MSNIYSRTQKRFLVQRERFTEVNTDNKDYCMLCGRPLSEYEELICDECLHREMTFERALCCECTNEVEINAFLGYVFSSAQINEILQREAAEAYSLNSAHMRKEAEEFFCCDIDALKDDLINENNT